MTSANRAKGLRNQRKVIKELQDRGFLVDKVEKTGRFCKEKDLFGLFDLIAIYPGRCASLIQVTTNRPHTHKKYQEFAKTFPRQSIEQWVYYDRKGFVIFVYNDDGTKTEFDNRK